MNTADNKRTLGYVAGACFALCAIFLLVNDASAGINLWTIVALAGAGLIAAGLFITKPILAVAGCGLYAVSELPAILDWIKVWNDLNQSGINMESELFANIILTFQLGGVVCVLMLVCWVILLFTALRTNLSKQLGIVAGIVAFAGFVFYFSALCVAGGGQPITDLIGNNFGNVFYHLCVVVGCVLLGLAFYKVPSGTIQTSNTAPHTSSPANGQAERLSQLKALLDNQVITQEEFEEKKKQIIGDSGIPSAKQDSKLADVGVKAETKASDTASDQVNKTVNPVNSAIAQMAKGKNMPLLIGAVASGVVVVVLIGILVFGGGKTVDFTPYYDEYCSSTWARVASDGSSLTIQVDYNDLYDDLEDVLWAADGINRDLGLPDSVRDEIGKTKMNDAEQKKTFKKQGVTVTWSLNYDGFKLTYTRAK